MSHYCANVGAAAGAVIAAAYLAGWLTGDATWRAINAGLDIAAEKWVTIR